MLHRRLRLRESSRLFQLVVALLILLGSAAISDALVYSILPLESLVTVNSPSVILQNGTTGTSTIYTNSTSAKVSVEAPLFDYVDNNDPDVDSSAEMGMHSNFPAQQAGPDSTYDTLTEENTEAIEDYVDNNTSDEDGSSDVGTHSNFENQKDYDSIYDTLTEQNTGVITKVGTDTSGTGTSLTLSFSHTLASGAARIVIVSIGVENGDTIDVSTVTYGGVTMTLAVERITGTSGFRYLCEIWYVLENDLPSDGSQTVEINCSGTAYELEVNGFCSEYTGVTQGAPEATNGTSQLSGNTISNTISPSDDSWVISISGSGNAGSFTHGQGQVEVLDFQDASSTFAVAELKGVSGETSLSSTYSGTVNRLCRVAASWTEEIEDDNYELDLEIQFTAVIDFLPTETLCINTGTFSGSEDINVDFWNGSGWENLATDLTAYSCNEYAVPLTSGNFTIRFKGGAESSDTTQDQWQIDASLLRVEGAGSKEDAVDQQSNVDGSADIGTHSNFTAEQYGPDSIYDILTEADTSAPDNNNSVDSEIIIYGSTTGISGAQTVDGITENVTEVVGYQLDVEHVVNSIVQHENYNLTTRAYRSAENFYLQLYNFSSSQWFNMSTITASSLTWYNTTFAKADFVNSTNQARIRYWQGVDATQETLYVDYSGVYGWNTTNYELDLEVKWTDVHYSLPNETLCIYGGTMESEDIKVDVWNGTGWETVLTDLSSGWNNASITDWLTNSNLTIRFKGGNETGDTSEDTWQIDVVLIHVRHDGGESYELDLEVQWTNSDYDRTNEELCIKTGAFTGSENIQVKVWNNTGSSWHWVMNITASTWNNVSIAPYLTSSTFTVQFLGGTDTGDSTQDSWNIDATLLHIWSGWLSGWDKRVRITIDRNDIDTALSNFPILVHLSNSSSGRSNDDVSFIFAELQNDTNRKKIAVTESDGLTQCYVEVEKWDDVSEKAWLWIKAPSLSNITDTALYLYYDKDHADNMVYVGDTGSTAAQNVWDASFKGVWHLNEPSGGVGTIKDSTSNNNVGTDNGSPTFNATGLIDSAISFDGFDDYINMSNSASLQFTSSLTIEAWINLDSFGTGSDVDSVLRKGEGNPNDYQLAIHDQKLALMIEENDDAGLESSASLTATTWYYLAGTWNGSLRRDYLNGSEDGSGSKTGNIVPDTRDIYIGGRSGTDLSTGVIDEVRASNTTRSAAWVKASYESGRDDLLDFGSEETPQNFDYVLRVNNTAADSHQIRLKKYSDSNINRLQNCTIYFHNSTMGTSSQIVLENGLYVNQTGPWYDLDNLETIYIAMTVQANVIGTSYIYIYLEALVPGSTIYTQYIIAFRID